LIPPHPGCFTPLYDRQVNPLRAFDLLEKRGRELGRDWEDWLNAERELLGASASELAEKDGVYELQVTLPGFESKDIEVTARPNRVMVHAAKEEHKKTRTATRYGPSLAPTKSIVPSRSRIRSTWIK